MSRQTLSERINQGIFIVDGAMGTQLMAAGAPAGACNEYLCIESPQIVEMVHKTYLDAGCDAIITNSFGGNEYILARHGHADKVGEINTAAAKIARKAAGGEKYVLGGLGPCGDFLEPIGPVKPDELKAAFVAQVSALAGGDIDGFIIETMSAVEEMAIAVEAVKSVSDLPVLASFAYDPAGDEFRTMMGLGVAQAVEKLASLGIFAIGFNCGTLDMDRYVKLAAEYAVAIGDSPIVLLAEPNAGRPELIDDKAVYTLSPTEYAEASEKIKAAGAKILGGCCGTTPSHIEAMAKKLNAG